MSKKNKIKEKTAKGDLLFALFTSSSSWIFLVLFLLVPTALIALELSTNEEKNLLTNPSTAYYQIDDFGFETASPVELNGTWFAYENVYFDSPQLPVDLLPEESQVMTLPVSDFTQATGMMTYQIFVNYPNLSQPENPTVLGTSYLEEDVSVYLNGHLLEPYRPLGENVTSLYTNTFFHLGTYYDPDLEYQEIVISTNNQPEDTDLYQRIITISSHGEGVYQQNYILLAEIAFAGIAYCLLLVGFIYLIIRPVKSNLTLINLFDIVLIVYVIYAHTSISPFLGKIFDTLNLSDTMIRGFALFCLCMAIVLGNDMINHMFLCKKKIHPLFNDPINICFITLSFVFMANPFLSSGICYYVMILGTIFVAIGILIRIHNYITTEKLSPYMKFQIVKTLFIMVIIAVDIITLHHFFMAKTFLLSQYCLFFLIHLFVRAYEYALPEKKVAEINRNLETTVAERTAELTRANQVLKDLSTRDALTNAYNRMYFEEMILHALEQFHHNQGEEPLKIYLCIFDLDNFKQINDHFGHNTGDEQLIETIKMAQDLMPEDVVVSRIGGEEFTFLFQHYEAKVVLDYIEKMRCALEARAQEQEGRTTGSFGVTQATVFSDRKTFFVHADECLYYSKQHGKNCITHDFSGEHEIIAKTT
ncbi:MAG: diguanylate cyclase [Eubacteriales bacterium]